MDELPSRSATALICTPDSSHATARGVAQQPWVLRGCYGESLRPGSCPFPAISVFPPPAGK